MWVITHIVISLNSIIIDLNPVLKQHEDLPVQNMSEDLCEMLQSNS